MLSAAHLRKSKNALSIWIKFQKFHKDPYTEVPFPMARAKGGIPQSYGLILSSM